MPTPNTIQLRFPDGSIAYPITDVSCVMGLNGSAVTEAILCWDGASTPVVADIPAGVTVTYNTTTYTGTLAASASTVGKIYMVATGVSNNYDRYMTFAGGSSYVWENIGDTTIDLTTYAKQADLSQLEAEIDAKLGFEQAIPSYTDGYSLNNSGELITNAYVTGRGVSDFFKVTPGGQLYVQSGVYQGGNYNYAAIAFYSSNSESSFISCINSAPYATEITDKTFTVPGTANYARVVLKDYSVPAIIGKQDKTVKELIDETNERIDESLSVDTDMSDTSTNAVENKVIKGYVDSVTGYPISVIKSAIDGYSLDNTGQAITNAYVTARGVSDFFGVTPGGKLYVHSGVYQGGNYNYAAIAFYSSNSESAFVSCINSAPYFTEIIDKEFDVPSTASYARVVLNDYSVAAILGYGSSKTIKQRIDELSIAKNYGKGIVVLGGSHTARENSEAAKDIWRDKLGMSVYTAGVGSCGIIANITMYGWTYNGVSYYTRGGYNDGVNSRVWDDYGYLSDVKITAVGETTITLSDGNTYSRDTTKDYINNAQTKISRLLSKSALDKDIYVVWLSTNDYVQAKSLGTYSDYTEVDNYDTTKKWTDASHPGTICGGFNFILKTIRDNNPTAEIYLFTSFRYFNSDARGYDPYTSVVNTTGKNFYEYQQEVMKAAQVGGCAILDQFLLQGVGIGNYSTYYESDHLHLKVSGYEKIGYLQADFLRNGM